MLRRVMIIIGSLLGLALVLAGSALLARHELLRIYEDLPSFTHAAGDVSERSVEMRDGVNLATTIYRPEGTGPWPTVSVRNPYSIMELFVGTWSRQTDSQNARQTLLVRGGADSWIELPVIGG
jgi:hypothetical protein